MIIEKLKQDKLQAMKDKNVVLRDLIWIVLTNIQIKEKEKTNVELSEKDYIKIIEKEMKQIEDTISFLKDENQIKDEKVKLEYLTQFIPEEMNEDEVKRELENLIKENNLDKWNIWAIMKIAKEKVLPLNIVNKLLRGRG